MSLFYQPLLHQDHCYLDAEEARHCNKVLRKKEGDIIQVTNGRGLLVDARIIDVQKEKCTFEILNKIKEIRKDYSIHLAIAPTKNQDRMEWMVEKVVEMGVDKISFIVCDHSEKSYLKMERINKMALSAMKQSLKSILPEINPPLPFQKLLKEVVEEEKYIAHVDFNNPSHLFQEAGKHKNYCIAIGPEGDFSEDEITQATSHGFRKVSLGNSRLRTETAGIIACHTLILKNL